MLVDLLFIIFQVMGANMASMRLIGLCAQVCPEWRGIAAGLRANTTENGFTAMYELSAVAFGSGLRVQMQDMYANAIAAEMRVRQRIMQRIMHGEVDHALEDEIRMDLSNKCQAAVLFLVKGLQEHLMHEPTMIQCLIELMKLIIVLVRERFVPMHLTRSCQWPVLKILQAHPGESMLGWHALKMLQQLNEVMTRQVLDDESIQSGEDRLIAHDIVSGYLARFRPSATEAVRPAVREILKMGDAVLTWI